MSAGDPSALRVFTGLVEAAMYLGTYELPERFAGYRREEYGVPVHYPVACHPWAWASGAVPYPVEALLGLVPEAIERRLRVVRPVLPAFVDRVEVRQPRIGGAASTCGSSAPPAVPLQSPCSRSKGSWASSSAAPTWRSCSISGSSG